MCQTEIKFRFATENDNKDVISLWNVCFPGDVAFRDYFFSEIYKPQYNLLLFKDDVLCAMAQMLPYKMQNNGKIENVTYIYGACTSPEYRKQHLMARLLNHSFEIDISLGKTASILIPQEEWLFGFYAKFGYKPTLKISESDICGLYKTQNTISVSEAKQTDIKDMHELYSENLWFGVSVCRDKSEWEKQINMFNSCGGKAICMRDSGKLLGYAFVWLENDRFWAQEFVYAQNCKDICIYNMQRYFSRANCRISGLQFSNIRSLGCVRRHDNQPYSDGYINLMLN